MLTAMDSEFGVPAPTADIPTAGRTDRAIVNDLFAHFGITNTPGSRALLLRSYLDRLPAELSRRHGVVLPGVQVLLDRLAGRGDVTLGLLTGNFEAAAEVKLRHFRLARYFRLGAYGDDHDDRNDVARHAMSRIKEDLTRRCAVERVVVIGDTPADVACAAAVGAVSVAVATGRFDDKTLSAADPHHLFPDLSDTDRLLEIL